MRGKKNLWLDGYLKGRAEAREIVAQDLSGIYGALAIALVQERHWKPETVMQLVKATQRIWNDNNGEDMIAKCKEITGIEFDQVLFGEVE